MRPLLAALLAVACSAPAPEFHQQAAQLCSDANRALDRIPLPAEVDFDTMLPVLEESARIHSALVVDLRRLDPPPQDRPEIAAWLDTASRAVTSLERGNAAVRTGNPDASLAPYDQADRLGSDAARAATALGLDGCFVALSGI